MGERLGEVVAVVEVDGQRRVDVLFEGYGQVCGVPEEELEGAA